MTLAGQNFYLNYITAIGTRPDIARAQTTWQVLQGGMWFSIPALVILGSHELGHYFACRYYRIPATLPYFTPVPGTLLGTVGAVIRMGMPLTRKALFDVGIAGPIAGFLVLLPFAIYGVSASFVITFPVHAGRDLMNFGDPLLLTQLQHWFFGELTGNRMLVMHPTGFAVWFGLLATALNLFPAGQLDGGHIVYALVGRTSRYVTLVSIAVLLCLTVFVSYSWALWTGLLVVMTYLSGLAHPPVADEGYGSIGRARLALSVFAVVMFILCFTPVPISLSDFVAGR